MWRTYIIEQNILGGYFMMSVSYLIQMVAELWIL
jgi:hypothetical protein